MSFNQLKGQPIYFDKPSDCDKCNDDCICQVYNQEDFLQWQGKQNPCGDAVLCPMGWDEGAEIIVNGNFASGGTGWTLGTGVTTTGNKICGGSDFLKAIQNFTVPNSGQYILRYTISDVSGTPVSTINLYNVDTSTPLAMGELLENGDYEVVVDLSSGVNYRLRINNLGTYCATNISLKQLANDCDWQAPAWDSGWTINPDDRTQVCYNTSPGAGGVFKNLSTTFIKDNQYYKLILKLQSTSGALTIYFRGVPVIVSGNGTHELYFTSGMTGDAVVIQPDANFTGCILGFTLYQMQDNWKAFLLDENGNKVADLSLELDYFKDWITLKKRWDVITDLNGDPLPYGCYSFALADPCVNTNGQFNTVGHWEYYDVNGSLTSIKTEAGLSQDCEYDIKICYADKVIDSSADVHITITGDTTISQTIPASLPYQTSPECITFKMKPDINGEIELRFDFLISTSGNIQLTYKITGCAEPDYTSNCLCWKEDNGCMKLVEGYADNSAYGFEFANTGFTLAQRLAWRLTPSDYPEQLDEYIYSNGKREQNFAQVEKMQQLFFEGVNEKIHDCIALQRRLKHFKLEIANGVLREYYAKPGAYQPEWLKNGASSVAPSRFDVRKKEDDIFANNCT